MLAYFGLCLFLSTLHSTGGQTNCPPSNVALLTEADLQQFQQCQTVDGDLVLGVKDCSQQCNISIASLTSLNGIRTVNGDFIIQCCNDLTGISALPSLIEVKGQLKIFYNSKLLNVGGFSGLGKAGSIVVSQNPALLSITGFGSLIQASGFISVVSNPVLTGITGFTNLVTISGEKLVNDHGLAILYNPSLTGISGFRLLNVISFGTVHIQGNTKLCYAGYPLWNFGSYNNRYDTGDKGIDWRSVLSTTWQFSWESTTGVPSLVIQDNGNETTCASTTCDSFCQTGAGCFGPDDPNLCGSCYLTDTINSCNAISRTEEEGSSCSNWWPPTEQPFSSLFAIALSFGIVCVVLLLVVVCLIVCRIRASFSNEKRGGYWISSTVPDERGYEPARASKPLYGSPRSNLKSSEKERTVIGRGAGSSTSSTPNVWGGSHRPHKTSKGGLGNESMSSVASSTRYGQFNGVPPASAKRDNSSTNIPRVMIPDKQNSNSHPYTTVSYTNRGSSPNHHYKDTLKSSERVLQSINEQQLPSKPPPPPPPPPTLPAESSSRRERVEDSPWEEVSDIGQGMQSHLREDAWSEEDNSFEDDIDEEEEVDGGDVMEFPSDKIKLGRLIGKGSFGKVFEAEAYGLIKGEEVSQVVIKQSNSDASEEELEIFLQPAEAMKHLKHNNVLGLHGVSVDGPSIMMILEYCSNDNLKSYLKKQKPNLMRLKHEGTLVHQMIVDIAEGLYYLHSMEIAHNDLAARNCLVTHNNRVKVGDYGYSRTLFRTDYYSRTPGQMCWPIRWMSPEILLDREDGILDSHPATELSNVWSYGILLWEVCTFGDHPYPRMTDEDVIELLKTTGRCNMKNPVPASDPIHSFHSVMKSCWKAEAERASMEEIVKRVNAIKDEFRPVRYSGRPSRPAPKKPVNTEAQQRVRGAEGAAKQNGLEEGEKVEPMTITVSAEVEERADDRLGEEERERAVGIAEKKGRGKSEKPVEQEARKKGRSIEQVMKQKDRPTEQKVNKEEEPVKQVTEHAASPTELSMPHKDKHKKVKKPDETKKATGSKPEVKPKPKTKPKPKPKQKPTKVMVKEDDKLEESSKTKRENKEEGKSQKEPGEEEDAVPITLPPARDSWGDLDADMFSNEIPPVIPPVLEEDYIAKEDSEEEEVSVFREDPVANVGSVRESREDKTIPDPLSELEEDEAKTDSLSEVGTQWGEVQKELRSIRETEHVPLGETGNEVNQPRYIPQPEDNSTVDGLTGYSQSHTEQQLQDDEFDSWDEFEVDDTVQVVSSEQPERKESFQLPPESPERTPPLNRRPSYLTPHDEEEDEEEESRDSPPAIPTSLPPEDEDEDGSENNWDEADEYSRRESKELSSLANSELEEEKPYVPPPDEFSQSELSTEPSMEQLEQKETRPEEKKGSDHDEEDDLDDLKVEEPVKLDFLTSRSVEPQQQSLANTETVKPKETMKQRKEREKREKELEKKKKRERKEREKLEKKQKQKSKGKKTLDDSDASIF